MNCIFPLNRANITKKLLPFVTGQFLAFHDISYDICFIISLISVSTLGKFLFILKNIPFSLTAEVFTSIVPLI